MGMEHLLAGCGAGLTSTLILHPLDFLKIRFQDSLAGNIDKNRQYNSHAGWGTCSSFCQGWHGLVHAIRTIIKTEGRQAMYQGLSANVFGSAAAWGSYFFTYEKIK
eukprot:gene30811-15576_t